MEGDYLKRYLRSNKKCAKVLNYTLVQRHSKWPTCMKDTMLP